jgi:hypothetical protein
VPEWHVVPNLTGRRHQQTRADIAEAAIGLFRDRGFQAVTMDDSRWHIETNRLPPFPEQR